MAHTPVSALAGGDLACGPADGFPRCRLTARSKFDGWCIRLHKDGGLALRAELRTPVRITAPLNAGTRYTMPLTVIAIHEMFDDPLE
jgi:hypothetical protein